MRTYRGLQFSAAPHLIYSAPVFDSLKGLNYKNKWYSPNTFSDFSL